MTVLHDAGRRAPSADGDHAKSQEGLGPASPAVCIVEDYTKCDCTQHDNRSTCSRLFVLCLANVYRCCNIPRPRDEDFTNKVLRILAQGSHPALRSSPFQ